MVAAQALCAKVKTTAFSDTRCPLQMGIVFCRGTTAMANFQTLSIFQSLCNLKNKNHNPACILKLFFLTTLLKWPYETCLENSKRWVHNALCPCLVTNLFVIFSIGKMTPNKHVIEKEILWRSLVVATSSRWGFLVQCLVPDLFFPHHKIEIA